MTTTKKKTVEEEPSWVEDNRRMLRDFDHLAYEVAKFEAKWGLRINFSLPSKRNMKSSKV